MSTIDDLLAKMIASGASVTVVHNTVQAGATLTMNIGCHFGGGHTNSGSKTRKGSGRKANDQVDEEDLDSDEEITPAHDRNDRGNPAPAAPATAPAGTPAPADTLATPAPAALLQEVKSKVALLQDDLINKVRHNLERLDNLSEDDLLKVKDLLPDRGRLDENELNELDELFDNLFPDLKDS